MTAASTWVRSLGCVFGGSLLGFAAAYAENKSLTHGQVAVLAGFGLLVLIASITTWEFEVGEEDWIYPRTPDWQDSVTRPTRNDKETSHEPRKHGVGVR
jgi:hypothetical protein